MVTTWSSIHKTELGWRRVVAVATDFIIECVFYFWNTVHILFTDVRRIKYASDRYLLHLQRRWACAWGYVTRLHPQTALPWTLNLLPAKDIVLLQAFYSHAFKMFFLKVSTGTYFCASQFVFMYFIADDTFHARQRFRLCRRCVGVCLVLTCLR